MNKMDKDQNPIVWNEVSESQRRSNKDKQNKELQDRVDGKKRNQYNRKLRIQVVYKENGKWQVR